MDTLNTLTREEFTLLNFDDKLKTVWNKGNFVDSHITSVGESKIINLYKFAKFYVEIVYSEIGTKVKQINSYKPGDGMLSYIPFNKQLRKVG